MKLTVNGTVFTAENNTNLLDFLRKMRMAPTADCGGRGICGKCKVCINGEDALACQTIIDRELSVKLPEELRMQILSGGRDIFYQADSDMKGFAAAIDLGTTTIVCSLLDHYGRELASTSTLNPQVSFGADVISRIQAALDGHLTELTDIVRSALANLIMKACTVSDTDPKQIRRIAMVGNPCMQELFLGIMPENLSRVPFEPVLTKMQSIPASPLFPICPDAEFLIVPDLSGYVGADTLGCVLSTEMYRKETMTLLVDIGTNGELVLGNRNRMIACSTAAGPALEGACIQFGMRAGEGAIDHVTWGDGEVHVSVIGEKEAQGICGSGIIDAVAVMLEQGIINHRGRIQSEAGDFQGERAYYLTEKICLTQTDIRQVQLAKGAIAAGIRLMTDTMGISLEEIDQVLLAGAFGSYITPQSACRIGLLPYELFPKICVVGNAARSGAERLACSQSEREKAIEIYEKCTFLELASLPEFQKTFGKETGFAKEAASWKDG